MKVETEGLTEDQITAAQLIQRANKVELICVIALLASIFSKRNGPEQTTPPMEGAGTFSNAELEQAIARTEKIKAKAEQDGDTGVVQSCEDATAYIRDHWMKEGGDEA